MNDNEIPNDTGLNPDNKFRPVQSESSFGSQTPQTCEQPETQPAKTSNVNFQHTDSAQDVQSQSAFNPNQQFPGINQSSQKFAPNQQTDNFYGHNHNVQTDNPFMVNGNMGNYTGTSKEGIISTVFGALSIVLNIFIMMGSCNCFCRTVVINGKYYNPKGMLSSVSSFSFMFVIVAFVSIVLAIVGIVVAAKGKKKGTDSLLTTGLVLSIVGLVLAVVILLATSVCVCFSDYTLNVASYRY